MTVRMYSSAYGAPPTTTSFMPRVCDDGQARPRLDEHVRVVLRLEAADEEDVAARLEAELVERRAPVPARVLDAVGDDADAPAVAVLVDVGDGVGVGDRAVGPARRVALGEAQVALGGRGPLAAVGVQAVDVDDGRDAGEAGDEAQRRVAGDEEQRDVGLLRARGVQRGEQRVRERVQVLVADRRQVHEPRALVGADAPVDDVRAAVDDDLVAALGQPLGELLGGRLEARVGRGDPAGAQDGDLHRRAANAAHRRAR